jgi:hypothetical protein
MVVPRSVMFGPNPTLNGADSAAREAPRSRPESEGRWLTTGKCMGTRTDRSVYVPRGGRSRNPDRSTVGIGGPCPQGRRVMSPGVEFKMWR